MLLCPGDLVLDILVFSPKPSSAAEQVAREVRLCGGGSAANVASWATYLGMPARFVGYVGRDWIGDWLAQDLSERGVDVVVERVSHPTGVVAVWVAGRERAMACAPGANRLLPRTLVEPAIWDDVGHVHFTGYSLLRKDTRSLVGQAKRVAHRRGCSVSLDPGSTALLLSALGRRGLREALQGVDVLFPNRDEALALTGARRIDRAAHKLAQMVPLVLVKAGSKGCWLATPKGAERFPTSPAQVRDPTGAGDAFAAGFLSAWLGGGDLLNAVQAAHRAGAWAVQALGGRPPCAGQARWDMLRRGPFSARTRKGGGPRNESRPKQPQQTSLNKTKEVQL